MTFYTSESPFQGGEDRRFTGQGRHRGEALEEPKSQGFSGRDAAQTDEFSRETRGQERGHRLPIGRGGNAALDESVYLRLGLRELTGGIDAIKDICVPVEQNPGSERSWHGRILSTTWILLAREGKKLLATLPKRSILEFRQKVTKPVPYTLFFS